MWVARIGMVGALGLVLVGLRQFAADVLIAPARDVLADIQDGKPRAAEDVQALVRAEKSSLAIAASAQTLSDLSLAQTALAGATEAAEAKQALLAEARANLRSSLESSPANPYAWLRLALLSRALGQPDSETYRYWQMSVMTGPNEDKILTPRIKLAVDLWPLLGNADRQAVFADIRNLWAHDHGWEIATDATPFMVNVIRAALVTDIKVFMEYEAVERARQMNLKNARQNTQATDQK